MVRQGKGKKHILYIRRKAMRLWKELNFEKGLRDDCIKEVLKRHRERVWEGMSKYGKQCACDVKSQKEFSYYTNHCDNNGWVG